MPARSVLTSTPFTARIEPTALSTGCQVCARAMLEVTAAGGGAIFAPMAMPGADLRDFEADERREQKHHGDEHDGHSSKHRRGNRGASGRSQEAWRGL